MDKVALFLDGYQHTICGVCRKCTEYSSGFNDYREFLSYFNCDHCDRIYILCLDFDEELEDPDTHEITRPNPKTCFQEIGLKELDDHVDKYLNKDDLETMKHVKSLKENKLELNEPIYIAHIMKIEYSISIEDSDSIPGKCVDFAYTQNLTGLRQYLKDNNMEKECRRNDAIHLDPRDVNVIIAKCTNSDHIENNRIIGLLWAD